MANFVTTLGDNDFFERVVFLIDNIQDVLAAVGKTVGVAAESIVSDYPPVSGKPLEKFYSRTDAKGHTYKSKFKSLKQQRYVMALGARGGIPTRRTGSLGKSITSDITDLSDTGVTVVIGTNRPYAPYVIGTPEEGQSHYHQGTWTPLNDDIANNIGKLQLVAQKEFSRQITAALSGGGNIEF